jgi:hypothetical protein
MIRGFTGEDAGTILTISRVAMGSSFAIPDS